ncbi:MAG: hypothetical protein ABI836_11020 [Gemmatimonadota bacterium]
MKHVRKALVLAAMLIGTQAAQAQTQKPVDSLALARQYTIWFYAGMADSLLAHYNPADSVGRGEADNILGALDQLTARAGNEVSVIEEKFVKRNGHTQYWRTAKFDGIAEPILLRWVILPGGYIGGMGLGPLSQAPPIDPN